MIDFWLFAGIGKLFIWLTRQFPPARFIFSKWELSRELFDCDLCLGFWVYLVLSFFFNINVIKNKYVNNIVLAGFTTFIMHLISIGWNDAFGEIVIEDA